MDRERVIELRNIKADSQYDWYRCDKVAIFNPLKMLLTIGKVL